MGRPTKQRRIHGVIEARESPGQPWIGLRPLHPHESLAGPTLAEAVLRAGTDEPEDPSRLTEQALTVWGTQAGPVVALDLDKGRTLWGEHGPAAGSYKEEEWFSDAIDDGVFWTADWDHRMVLWVE